MLFSRPQALLFLLFFAAFSVNAVEVFVAISKNNLNFSPDKNAIKDIYLGRSDFTSAAGRVHAAFYVPNAQELDDVISEITEVEAEKYNSIWRRKLFSGAAIPPIKLKTEEELIQFTSTHNLFLIITNQKKLPVAQAQITQFK